MLVEDTACTCEEYLFTSREEDSLEHRDKIYQILVIQGKTVVRGLLDHEEGEGRGVPARVHVPQDRPAFLGSPPLKSPRSLLTDSTKSRGRRRQATGNGAIGHHR